MAKRKAKVDEVAKDTGDGSLPNKDYEKELKKLHVELVKLQEWVEAQGAEGLRRVRGAGRRRQGGHDQGHHRARQPARLPGHRVARADRARKVADVHPAVSAASARGRRNRDLRPELVQPRRRRAGHGILHRRAGAAASCRPCRSVEKAMVESGIILLKYWLEVSPEEQTRRLEGADRRRPQDLEALADGSQVVQPLVRLFAGAGRDVRGDRHAVGALVRGSLGRQEAGG